MDYDKYERPERKTASFEIQQVQPVWLEYIVEILQDTRKQLQSIENNIQEIREYIQEIREIIEGVQKIQDVKT